MAITKRFITKNGLDSNNNTIINVVDPINAQDAATKNFSSNASNLTTGTVSAGLLPVNVTLSNADNSTNTASTAFVHNVVNAVVVPFSSITSKPTTLSGYGITDAALAASPVFTGTPTLPTGTIAITQTAGDVSTKLATTAFVKSAIGGNGTGVASSNAKIFTLS